MGEREGDGGRDERGLWKSGVGQNEMGSGRARENGGEKKGG